MHDHGHSHDHRHGPGHSHAPASFGRAFAIGIGLNTAFVLVEAGYGIASNSVALLADAGHNLSDVLGLVVAWVAAVLTKRPPSERYTYGLRGSSILAALFLFASGRKGDLNIRGAYLHMAADAAVSAGVLVAGLVILWTGWLWLDPFVSLVIVVVIVWGTWGLLRDSLAMSLGAVPREIEPGSVLSFLKAQAGVADVHDLHIWPMSTTETALTAHLVMPAGHPGDAFIFGLAEGLRNRHGIDHVTLQVEEDGTACPLAPGHVV